MGVILWAVFVAALSLVSGQRNPSISFISKETVTDIGATALLKCSVQFASESPVMWFKQASGHNVNDVPISTNNILIAQEPRFSIDREGDTVTLKISDIQESDQGTYECRVQISVRESISGTVLLAVRLKPVISDNSTRSVIVSEGETAEIACYATGFPTPEITWRRDNNFLLPTGKAIHRGNVLRMENIQKIARGTYYCVADNGVGRGSKRNVAVEVEFAPVITVPRPKVYQAMQYNMDLECLVEAYPPPSITWLKDGIVLNNNQHQMMSMFPITDQTTDSNLRTLTIEKKQYGNYTCRAANRLGTTESVVELVEAFIPVCPPACDVPGYSTNSRAPPLVLASAVLVAVLVGAVTAAGLRHH
ncbi:Lachesin [Amphibalanus amphitrite]|uniref:Lachesin n=1 Tax=Amphibalanus amphitrite TaxID=1232801 RepID=A0A6A4X3J0_AMPAM|nr:Lachesin [Amphibalanus amphitrite]